MLVQELIDISIKTLDPKQTVQDALDSIQDQLLQNVLVREENQLLGILSEDQLLDADPENVLEKLLQNLPPVVSIQYNSSEIEAFRLMSEHKLELLPVVDEEKNYLGSISMRKAFFHLAVRLNPSSARGIIVLKVHHLNYQLSQIAQITESGDARIFSVQVQDAQDNKSLLVTILTDKEDLDGVIQTFRRYEYDVVATFYQSIDKYRLQERYNSLMRYLNT
jgi:acetoin utilization protein AcuB